MTDTATAPKADVRTLRGLMERVQAQRPDDRLALDLMDALLPDADLRIWMPLHSPPLEDGSPVNDLGLAVKLVKRVLPGWIWSTCECSLSDDAWLMPDFNCPIHGSRLLEQFGSDGDSYWQEISDVDRRPPGNPSLAMLESLLRVLIAIAEREQSSA